MKTPLLLVLCLCAFTCFGQFTPYGLGLVQQPNSASARNYLQIGSGSGITNHQTSVVLGGTFTGTFSGTYNSVLNGILKGNGTTFGTVAIGSGLSYDGTTLSSTASGGTVTTFSAGNLSPLFTTSVANPSTTPSLSFSQVSQSANLVFAGPTSGGAANPTFRSLVAGDIPSLPYVTSVGLSLPSIFNVSGSPVTGSGTLTGTLANESANTVFAGPTSGGATTPTFRSLGLDDIPSITEAKLSFSDNTTANSTSLQHGLLPKLDGSASKFLAGDGSWGTPTGTGTSLPGLLTRPVQASSSGTLSAPQWPDDSTYYFDEEFDSWQGGSSGQFGRHHWTVTLAGGGGGVNDVASNSPPYFGIVELQSPTTTGNTASLTSYGSTGILPYGMLRSSPNWLLHAVFFLNVTNTGSIYRIGLIDSGYQAANTANNPSNALYLRFDKTKTDTTFVFEARRNAVIQTAASTIKPDATSAFKVTMYSTNSGTVMCQVNSETPVSLTNISDVAMTLMALDATTNGVANRLWLDRISFMANVAR